MSGIGRAACSPRARVVLATVLTGVVAGVAGTALTEALHLVQHLAFGYTEDTFLTHALRAPAPRLPILATLVDAVATGRPIRSARCI